MGYSKKNKIYLLCIYFIILCLASTEGATTRYRMSFKENQEPGSLVTDLIEIFNIETSLVNTRSFQIISQNLKSGNTELKEAGNWIVLDTTTNQLKVDNPIDRETECGDNDLLECVISLQVVMLPNQYFRIMKFEFVVTDVNDHAPKFPTPETGNIFTIGVNEDDVIGTVFSLDHLMAQDEDSGENSKIFYSLSRNDFFGLQQYDDAIGTPHLDLVIIKEPDYEIKRFHDLILTARDGGEPPRSSRVILKVKILDANDHAPVFDKKEYHLKLKENLGENTLITTLAARDDDDGNLGMVRYFLPKIGNSEKAQNLLTIDPENGEVRLKQELDREEHNGMRIVIGAKDSANKSQGGPKVGKTVIVIDVEDVNDNAPVIKVNVVLKGNDREVAYVPEDVTRGTFIAQISATDKDTDANGEVELSMTSFPPGYAIVLIEDLVKVNMPLDREEVNRYVLQITACDKGKRPKCSHKNVTVEVVDINDNSPKFSNVKKSFVVRENMKVGTLLTRVSAFDDDSLNPPALRKVSKNNFQKSMNGDIRYSITGGGAAFAIESTSGKITLVGSLDYEEKNMYKLVVKARDLGSPRRSNNTTIMVTVLDVNDHRPEFSNPAVDNSSIISTILETGPIAKIKASDRDTGDNAKVRYYIHRENDNKYPAIFILNPISGELRFNTSNNLREIIGDHKICIKAIDGGKPPLSSSTTLYIRVTDLPLSAIREKNGLPEEGLEPTVIILASLAAATIVLLLILAFIIVKCRKESKEIRTYNCRKAENTGGWISKPMTPPRDSSIDEVVVVTSPNNVTSTRDANFMRAMELGRQRSVISNRPSSRSSSEGKETSTTKDENLSTMNSHRHYDEYKRDVQTKSILDGDSGKGESDRESDRGEKDVTRAHSVTPNYHHQSMQYLNSMGPRCTENCRLYGHCDECWLNVSATALNKTMPTMPQHQSRNIDLGYALHPMNRYPNYPNPADDNFDNCSLETIGETQPLRYALESPSSPHNLPPMQDYPVYPSYNPHANHLMNQSYEEYYYPTIPEEMEYPREQYSGTNLIQQQNQVPDSYYTYSHRPSSRSHSPSPTTSTSTLKPSYPSPISPNFEEAINNRDKLERPSSRNSIANPESSSVSEKIKMFTNSGTNAVQRRPSGASLRDNLLQKRLLQKSASFSSPHSKIDDQDSSTLNYSGETTMQEAEEIISDIDQLISH